MVARTHGMLNTSSERVIIHSVSSGDLGSRTPLVKHQMINFERTFIHILQRAPTVYTDQMDFCRYKIRRTNGLNSIFNFRTTFGKRKNHSWR